MRRAKNQNLEILEAAVAQLGPLVDDLVFVGGCATGLLLTDAAAPPIRMTRDVDAITEVSSVADYHRLSNRLRKRGFKEDQSEDAPICRWIAVDIVLDVMPTNEEILGFGNEWYRHALNAAMTVQLPSGVHIRMVTAPYFLATKLAAFDGRGAGDYVASHDLEDIVAVLDGRSETVAEVQHADEMLRTHLRRRFAELLRNPQFVAALPGHLPGDAASQGRVPYIFDRINAIVG